MSILGSLFVELRANTASFTDGMSGAAKSCRAAGKEVEESFSHLGNFAGTAFASLGEVGEKAASMIEGIGTAAGKGMASLGKMGAVIAGIGAAGVGFGVVMFEAASKAAEMGSKIFEASEVTGLSAANLSGLAAVSKVTGESFETLTKGLAKAGVNLTKAIMEPGAKSHAVLAQIMGGAQNLAALGLKPMDDALQIVLQRIFAVDNEGERNVALASLLGKGWMENVETLKLLAEQGFGPAIEKAKQMNMYFGGEAAAQAHEFKVQVNTLKGNAEGLATSLGMATIPKINSLTTALFNAQSAMRSSATESEKWSEDLRAYMGGAVEFVTELITGKASTWATKLISSGSLFARETQAATNVDIAALPTSKNLEKIKTASEFAAKYQVSLSTAFYDLAHSIVPATTATKEHAAASDTAAAAAGRHSKAVKAVGESAHTSVPSIRTLDDELRSLAKSDYDSQLREPAKIMSGLEGPKLKMPEGEMPGGTDPFGTIKASLALPVPAALPVAKPRFPDLSAMQAQIKDATNDEMKLYTEQIRLIQQWDEAAFHVGSFGDRFKSVINEMVIQGKEAGSEMMRGIMGAIDGAETELAKLFTGQKTNFKGLFTGFAEEMTKATIQKGVGGLLGKLGFGGKADGSSESSALWVKLAGATAGVAGAAAGAAGGLGGLFSSVLGAFGGGKASGGDLTPGHWYVAGERGPEIIAPKSAGTAIPMGRGSQTVNNVTFNGAKEFDMFRRSENQIMAQFHRQSAIAYGRS